MAKKRTQASPTNGNGSGKADQRIDWEKETLLLMRLQDEDKEPEVERGQSEPQWEVHAALLRQLY